MFPNSFAVFFSLTMIIAVITCSFVPINWNSSTDRGNSHLEREYKYPMYQKVSPTPCDLSDSCDVFCCQDPDCDDIQKESFQCFEPEEHLSDFDCKSDSYNRPEWMSWFCYVFKNPIYLGKFYVTPKKIEKLGQLRNTINNKAKNLGIHDPSKPKSVLQYGSPIMTYTPMSDSFPSISPLIMKTPTEASSHACISKPVKYLVSGVTRCFQKLTPDICQHGQKLSMLPYLIQNITLSAPVVLKNLDYLEGIKTEIQIKCIQPKLHAYKLKKEKLLVFKKGSICEDVIVPHQTVWNKPICENVLAYVQHHFTINGSDLVKLHVEYGVMNLEIPSDIVHEFSNSLSNEYIYTEQVFNISFTDIMSSNYSRQNSSKHDDSFSRGYFVGEQLNVGYKSFGNSSIWKKGFVGVFKNRRFCESLSPVTFGFDSLSSCEILTKFSNCTQLRNQIDKYFDSLLQGDRMAVYSNLRAPYNATVPVLRNYRNTSDGVFTNSTHCSVPLLQDCLIQHTTVVTKNGIPIHKITGVMVDRSYRNIFLPGRVALTSRVLFFDVSSSTNKHMSRFWTRMFSPELSENSWLNIFKAFKDVNTLEREEITFWCIFLAISFSSVIFFTKLDVNLGKYRKLFRSYF